MGISNKPKVLLCWAYHRQHWVKVFNHLKDDFDFVFLNWVNPDFEITSFTDSPKAYWFNYKNIQELVDEIKPDKVVFMGVDAPLTILLNHLCKSRDIPTFMMQHGIFHPYEAYLEEETKERKRNKLTREVLSMAPSERKGVNKRAGLTFLLRSLSLNTFFPVVTSFQIQALQKLFKSQTKALFYTKHSSRRASTYIVFTRYCSTILKIRDGVPEKAIIEVGNPEAEDTFSQINEELSPIYCSKDYYLLIDDPLGEVGDYDTNGILSKEEVNAFHQKLNKFALLNNKKLLIKLHPDSYKSTFFTVHENIQFIKEANVANLIKFSSGVFGGTSTLLIPALKLKPCCLFKYNDTFDLHNFLISINYCPILNYLSFAVEDIHFNDMVSESKQEKFKEAYLFSDDQKSISRIKALLLKSN